MRNSTLVQLKLMTSNKRIFRILLTKRFEIWLETAYEAHSPASVGCSISLEEFKCEKIPIELLNRTQINS